MPLIGIMIDMKESTSCLPSRDLGQLSTLGSWPQMSVASSEFTAWEARISLISGIWTSCLRKPWWQTWAGAIPVNVGARMLTYHDNSIPLIGSCLKPVCILYVKFTCWKQVPHYTIHKPRETCMWIEMDESFWCSKGEIKQISNVRGTGQLIVLWFRDQKIVQGECKILIWGWIVEAQQFSFAGI